MEINKKSAPQNTVIDIIRKGQWGDVVYLHKLSCGHMEPRKRPAKTEKIACSMCVMASTFTKMSAEFVRTGVGYEGYEDIEIDASPFAKGLKIFERYGSSFGANLVIRHEKTLTCLNAGDRKRRIGGEIEGRRLVPGHD